MRFEHAWSSAPPQLASVTLDDPARKKHERALGPTITVFGRVMSWLCRVMLFSPAAEPQMIAGTIHV
jgi:hypothetical protein